MQRLILLSNHLSANQTEQDQSLLPVVNSSWAEVTINRPSKMNTFTVAMAQRMQSLIKEWHHKKDIKVFILKSADGPAFCAGGDLKQFTAPSDNPFQYYEEIDRTVYNLSIMRPTLISLIDGVVMGTGVGVSYFGKIKIVTENTLFAMPESRLGFITDVGSGWYLSRLRNGIGVYLAMTGAGIKGEDMVKVGLADFFVESKKMGDVEMAIKNFVNKKPNATVEEIKEVVKPFASKIESEYELEEFIAKHFTKPTVNEIFQSLQQAQSEDPKAQKCLAVLEKNCPMSIRINFEMQKRSLKMTFKEFIIFELNVGHKMGIRTDLGEGLKAFLFKKEGRPKWSPKSVFEIDEKEVEDICKIEKHFELDIL